MISFRSTSPQFGTVGALFSGQGAEEHPGRWNKRGTKAIYSSLEVAVAASERGFNSLVASISSYNNEVAARPGRFPRHIHEQILDRVFSFGKIQIDLEDKIIDLTKKDNLSHWLSLAGLPAKEVEDSRFSKYQKDHLWTRALGTYMADQGHAGIIVPSARSDKGHNAVFFEQNLPRNSYKILDILELRLSALRESITHEDVVAYGQRAQLNKIKYQSGFGDGTSEILMIGL